MKKLPLSIYIYEMYVCNYASTGNIIIFTMLSHNLLLDLCVVFLHEF